MKGMYQLFHQRSKEIIQGIHDLVFEGTFGSTAHRLETFYCSVPHI